MTATIETVYVEPGMRTVRLRDLILFLVVETIIERDLAFISVNLDSIHAAAHLLTEDLDRCGVPLTFLREMRVPYSREVSQALQHMTCYGVGLGDGDDFLTLDRRRAETLRVRLRRQLPELVVIMLEMMIGRFSSSIIVL